MTLDFILFVYFLLSTYSELEYIYDEALEIQYSEVAEVDNLQLTTMPATAIWEQNSQLSDLQACQLTSLV